MSQPLAALALACLTLACSGPVSFFPLGDRNSAAQLQLGEDATEASGGLLAFDPTRHSLDISIELPLDQADDIDIYIVTSNGIRYQVLGSFQDCRVDASTRRCPRQLPVLPNETTDNWRVEAQRREPAGPANIVVAVSWVPVD